ncbi:MAG: acyl-CoA/acyl-ACP dehydrogenase [Actinobacteria bacterium]|nr:acyl-CoA/acyl-ACP dehydrogenase [Actinomycetota bacterium]
MTADFRLSEEQDLLRETARSVLARECPPALVRAHIDDPAVVESLWEKHLHEWAALGDGPLVDLCIFAEELGAAVVPGPCFATAALGLPLLRAVADERADAVAEGELVATAAVAGRDGTWELNDDGVRTFVLEADRADLVAIVLPGPALAVVDAASRTAREIKTLDTTRRVFEIDITAEDRAVAKAVDAAALASVLRRATVALAAELVGTTRWLLEHTIEYAKAREQFGKPIGSFQGLQWKIVDMALDAERATAAAYYAAMAIDAGEPDALRAAHVAKATAGVAARHCAKSGMQVYGGIGYTWENDLHLYLRRAFASDYLLGSSTYHHDRLAQLLLDA